MYNTHNNTSLCSAGYSNVRAHAKTHTHSHSHSCLYAGSGVEERNVKHLLAQPQCDPTAGQHRSPQPDSQELGYLCARTRTHTHTHTQTRTEEWFLGSGVRCCQDKVSGQHRKEERQAERGLCHLFETFLIRQNISICRSSFAESDYVFFID